MLCIDVFLNLAKMPKRLSVKCKKVYGPLVKSVIKESFYKKMFL